MAQFAPAKNAIINHAIVLATMAHGNQVRKGNGHIPYVFHAIDVANEVIYYSGLPVDEIERASAVAILHDTVEDTAVTLEQICDQFGSEIGYGVASLSKNEELCGSENISKLDSLRENLARLKQAPRWVQAVKLADRASNLKVFPSFWGREKIACYLEEATLIANELKDASEGLYVRLSSRILDARTTLSLMSKES